MSKNRILRKTPKIPKEITKNWLLEQFEKLDNENGETLNYINKVKLLNDYSYYLDQIYNTNYIDEFEAEIQFCETKEEKDLWLGLRLKISSFEYGGNMIGRVVKILIRDKKTKKYVGIASIGSDIDCKLYDNYIGWDSDLKYKNKKFNHLMNITTCVAIPPFSFNYNAGKLVAMSMFSKEVYDYVKKIYSDELVCLTTFSLYGKSIQYDRLKELKYLGLTEGKCASQIPSWLSDCVNTFLSENTTKKFGSRLYKMQYLVSKFKFPKTIIKGTQKGAYIGFTGNEEHCKNFLQNKVKKFEPNKLLTISEISTNWKNRWATQRFLNLLETKKLMLSCDYITSVIDVKDYNRIKKIKSNKDTKDDRLTYDQKIGILLYFTKNNKTSMLQLSRKFTKEYKIKVDRRWISNLIYY